MAKYIGKCCPLDLHCTTGLFRAFTKLVVLCECSGDGRDVHLFLGMLFGKTFLVVKTGGKYGVLSSNG